MTRTDKLEGILGRCARLLGKEIDGKKSLTPKQFEEAVEKSLRKTCEGSEFEGKVLAEFGQKFPDITFEKDVYGVEVKFSKDKNLQTIGNSVLEGTRREGIDEIYILFGSFVRGQEPKFLWRKYEECCVDIAVTHYPRYKINMNARRGESIFDKIGVAYKELRKLEQEEILDIFRKYYRRNRASLWWLGRVDAEEDYVPATFKFLNEMAKEEQGKLLTEAYVYFPELIGNDRRNKYRGFVEWLLRNNIVCHNARDFFTSGGTTNRNIGKRRFFNISQVVARFCDNLEEIKQVLLGIDRKNLKLYWDLDKKPADQRWIIRHWVAKLLENLGDREHNERYLKIKLRLAFGGWIFSV